jgi:peptidyl-prolyl cis-trans isomerase SurA
MLQKIIGLTHLKPNPVNEKELWIYTDSSLQNKALPEFRDLNDKTILFSFGEKSILVKDWISYRKTIRNNPDLKVKTNNDWFGQYQQAIAFDYYRNHLENYNKDFGYQLNEFKEGNLLFEIMQRQVWDKASSDSAGLARYYDAHATNYWWQPGADAIIFACSNEKAAEDMEQVLQKHIDDWRRAVDSSRGLIQADSGRFELAQLPVKGMELLKPGQFTEHTQNQADNSVAMAYILRVYNERSPRSYKDARGFVINDYQNFLEEQWIAELKKKYPVKINEAVLKGLPK